MSRIVPPGEIHHRYGDSVTSNLAKVFLPKDHPRSPSMGDRGNLRILHRDPNNADLLITSDWGVGEIVHISNTGDDMRFFILERVSPDI